LMDHEQAVCRHSTRGTFRGRVFLEFLKMTILKLDVCNLRISVHWPNDSNPRKKFRRLWQRASSSHQEQSRRRCMSNSRGATSRRRPPCFQSGRTVL
jgi:hypothetical protein